MANSTALLGYTRCAVRGCMTAAVMYAVSVPLCREHVAEMRDHLTAATLDKVSRQQAAPLDALVYFARTEPGIVKIGMTTSPAARWRDLGLQYPGLTVMVVRPGNRRTEAREHRRFTDLRLGRSELFRYEPPLAAHVEGLQRQYPEWPDMIQRVQDRQGGAHVLVSTP